MKPTTRETSTIGSAEERGSALVVMLVALVGVGAMTVAHLTKVVAANNLIKKRMYVERAQAIADADLEIAKNIVNAATYSGEENTAIKAALLSSPPHIPGTRVEVTKVGAAGDEWFMLRAQARYQGIRRSSQTFVRQRSPVSAYNFFVIDHPLGISGAPRGAIHCNKSIDFYFPWGLYRDQVTASEGFNFKGGATPANTRLLGQWDMAAPPQDLLTGVVISDLAAKAGTLQVMDNLLAEIEFKGKTTDVTLIKPAAWVWEEQTGVRSVFSHYEQTAQDFLEPVYVQVTYTELDPVYERQAFTVTRTRDVYVDQTVTETYTEPIYEDQTVTYTESVPIYSTRTVTADRTKSVWVEDPPPDPETLEGGFAVGGEEPVFGHWETVTYTETVTETYISGYDTVTRTRIDRVKVGKNTLTRDVVKSVFSHTESYDEIDYRDVKVGEVEVTKTRQDFSHYETVTRMVDMPVYVDESYSYWEQVYYPEELVRTETVPTDGMIYIEKDIRSIKGQINGQISVVTNDDVDITGNLTYVDDAGQTRMLNGADPIQKYEFNPDYRGDSVLGIMARDDVRYSRSGPQNLEINASLIAVEGRVSYAGIRVSADGTTVTATDTGSISAVKESIRRLGGIVSRERPVTTYVDATNKVLAGYQKGISVMDRNLLLDGGGNVSPPYVFQQRRPSWALNSGGHTFTPVK